MDWQAIAIVGAVAFVMYGVLVGGALMAVKALNWLFERDERLKRERRRMASRERNRLKREKRQAERAALFAEGLKPHDGNVQVFQDEPYLNERRSAAVYRQSKFTPQFKTMKQVKYGGIGPYGAAQLVKPLAAQLVHTFRRAHWKVDIVVCVPSSAERLQERGFNQSELLAMMFSRLTRIPYRNVLNRRWEVEQAQVMLKRAQERAANLAGIFEAQKVEGLRVLIVDDVSTTGTTLNECAKALREGGALEVYGLTLFSGVNRKRPARLETQAAFDPVQE